MMKIWQWKLLKLRQILVVRQTISFTITLDTWIILLITVVLI